MTNKTLAESAFAEVENELCATSQWLYENPELAYVEFQASQRLSEFLRGRGFDVTYPSHGLDTAFEATIGSGGPRVVICCEYDALPDVGHACGHNIIATAALGAGAALAPLADALGIRVTVLGTPAEEVGGGKVDLINAGALDDAAASMMIHPGPFDMLDPAFQAVEHLHVEYFGKESHSAFAPQLGINALDAFVQAYVAISTFRQAMYPEDSVHCIITDGGQAPNVVPAYTRSEWYVRAASTERLSELSQSVRACFEAAAQATGCRVEINRHGNPYITMVNNPVMASIYADNSAAIGREMPTMDELGYPAGGSSDMGNVSHVVPSIHPMIGIDSGDAVNHQFEFADHTITPAGELAIRDGALAMAYTIIDMAERNVWADLA